jgi:hypothetical protein
MHSLQSVAGIDPIAGQHEINPLILLSYSKILSLKQAALKTIKAFQPGCLVAGMSLFYMVTENHATGESHSRLFTGTCLPACLPGTARPVLQQLHGAPEQAGLPCLPFIPASLIKECTLQEIIGECTLYNILLVVHRQGRRTK